MEYTFRGNGHSNGSHAADSGHDDFDFYEVLELNPNASSDTVQRVYRLLAVRYHPDNNETGSEEMFKKVLHAYRVLSDPEKRAAYDVQWHSQRRLQWKIFAPEDAHTKVATEKRKRRGILALLYTKRVNSPREPTMSLMDLEELLGCPREHLEFSLWYLKQQGWAERTDNARYSITAEGVDEAESHGTWPVPKDRMLPAAPKARTATPSSTQ